jgi:chemotaxis protein MotB
VPTSKRLPTPAVRCDGARDSCVAGDKGVKSAAMNDTKKSPPPGVIPAILAVVAIAALTLVVLRGLVPAQGRMGELEEQLSLTKQQLDEATEAALSQSKQISTLLKDKDDLSQKTTETKEQLTKAVEAKQQALKELAEAKKELSEALGVQIKSGDVLLTERNGELVVDVADKLLFDTGASELNEPGKLFLKKVAQSLRRLPRRQVFQVGGHTDSQRVVSEKVKEQYPTNWELSAARATNVTRFLQESGGIPGRQLVAAGYSQYQPAATNKTDEGRQKNRRIEIVLLRAHR